MHFTTKDNIVATKLNAELAQKQLFDLYRTLFEIKLSATVAARLMSQDTEKDPIPESFDDALDEHVKESSNQEAKRLIDEAIGMLLQVNEDTSPALAKLTEAIKHL